MKEEIKASTISGHLHLKLIRADLFINTEIFGEMDPFIIVKYGKKKFKTTVHRGAGSNPQWHQEFFIPIGSEKDSLSIFCYDEDFIVDDFIGLTTISIEDF
jgi:Ca2+-dependent lipid-binding protein